MAAFTKLLIFSWVGLAVADNFCHAKHGDAITSSLDDDQATHFLQISGHAKNADYRAASLEVANGHLTAVTPINCSEMKKPLQVAKGDDGYSVSTLDVSSGTYKKYFEVSFDAVEGGYRRLNGCGINPRDSIMYCAMWIMKQGAYLVRLDANSTVEFVARLPWYDLFNSAGFSMDGKFFLGNHYSNFLILKKVHTLKGVPSSEKKGKVIADYRKQKMKWPKGFDFSADAVIVDADLEGKGQAQYLLVLYGFKLQIAKVENGDFVKTWIIKVLPHRGDNVYGAGWNFQNRIFFASNRGNGVYRIPLENVTLPVGDDFELKLELIGKSDVMLGHNDGMNCQNVPDPWTSKVIPFPCKQNPGMLQAKAVDDKYDILALNHTTGITTPVFSIPLNTTSPPFRKMNSFAIGPIDIAGYATLVFDTFNMSIYPTPPPFYVVRFDEKGIEFVAKIQAERGSPIAGTFDKDGNYYVISNPSLIKLSAAHTMQGFETHTDPDLPFYDNTTDIFILRSIEIEQVADIVATPANFDGKGKTTWLVGANTNQQLLLVKVGDGPVTPYTLATNDALDGIPERQNFGAAWLFWGNIYVSSNDGLGVFKVPKNDIKVPQTERILLTKVGPSEPIEETDGLNCPKTRTPFDFRGGKYRTSYGSLNL